MMETITTGTRALDTRDGRVVTIGEKNSKCKTVIVYYDEPTEKEVNGKSMSFSTVKKHFDLQVWESDAETEKETYDVVTDEVEEIVAPEAEKTEKKARKKTRVAFEDLLAMVPLASGLTLVRMKNDSLSVKRGNKRLFRLDYISGGYQLTADRKEHLMDIEDVEILGKGKKTWARVRGLSADSAKEIMAAII